MEDNTIRITHYINPHIFWYKPVSAYVHNLEEKRFQLAIDEHCEANFRQANAEREYEVFPGETVAVLDFDRNKWCRCIVDEVLEDNVREKRYNLWAIDDGVPIQSSSRYVNPLPESLSSEVTSKVKRGAIKNVLPSEFIYDPQVDKLVSKITSRWDTNAASVLQTIIRNSATIYFRNVTRHTVNNVVVNFGDLEIVTRKGNVFSANHVLKEMRNAAEVEPRDFISRLSEMQTMNVNRSQSLTQNRQQNVTPMKPRYDTNGYSKMVNGVNDDANVRDLELNGVSEEDFDESASMVRPNNCRERPRQVPQDAIVEDSHSEEDLYPISASLVKAGGNVQYEKQLWHQRTRPPNHESFAQLKISDPFEKSKPTGLPKMNSSSEHSLADSKYDDQLDKPKASVTFLNKLEMRKKRPVQKSTSSSNEEQSPPKEQPSRYDNFNIVPAGFHLGNVGFVNGRVVTGDSSDSSERKSKNALPSFKLRQPSKQQQQQLRPSFSEEMHETTNGNNKKPVDDSSKVYVTKNTSRFDRLVEEEACIRSRLCHQRLLVHGKRIPKPVEKLENANFCPEVHRELSMLQFGSIHRIQTYAWPHILRGNSFFCVNAAATGKTFAYLPAICSSVMKMHDEDLVSKGAGPVAVVICRSSREVQRVASYCRKMLNSSINKSMVVVEAFGARDIPKACNLLLNSCMILIATAPGYRRVYENMPNAIVKERIQSVVIDNIDTIIERFGRELQLICKSCDKPELQMVVTATYWNPLFFGFLEKYKNMIICIGAYLEAAIYGKSNIMLRLKPREMKVIEVVNFVREHNYQNERTLIVCSNASEVYEIVDQLKSQSITHMYCNDTTALTKMDGFREWDNQVPGEMHVLVCYDATLPDLEIRKAQHVIHYSLPSSWTMFTRRFACAFGYYTDPFHKDSNIRKKPSSSLVLLDENNNEQLPKLVEFLRIHNQDVAEPILKLANNIRIQQEEQKLATGNPIDFCSHVLDFGKCRSTGCMKRHIFTTGDLSKGEVPTSGIVKMKIYNMFSPTHYTARLLEHRDYGANGWSKVSDTQAFFALDIEIQQHFANESRHCSHGDVHYNDWCVIFDEHRYWRCRVISIDQKKEQSTSKKVKVKLLDVGRTIDCVSAELLYLPKEFYRLPAQAIDVRIVGVVPHDFESEWDKRVTVTIREWIDKYTANDRFHVEGKILLAIRDMIWVDTIRLVEHLDGLNTEIHEIHVKSEIVGKNFGVTDKEPLELLTEMVVNCEAYRKRACDEQPINEESISEVVDDEVPLVCHDVNTSENSSTNDFFRSVSKCKEIDKPITPKKLLKPMEFSGTDSDDCLSEATENKTDVPEEANTSNVNSEQQTEDKALVSIGKIETFREMYDEIKENVTHVVFISQYYAPDDFYICRVEKFLFITSLIAEFTEAETNLVPLEQLQVGDYCLVLYDNAYQRAKITQVEGRDIRVFFLDLGGYDSYTTIDLFQLPNNLLTALPFCAIKGEMACLLPRENEDQGWSREIGDRIYDEVLANYRTFHAKVVETIKNTQVATLAACRCYRLLLFDPEHELESWIFDEIVELKFARYIEDERPYAIDINFGDDDFRQLINPNYCAQRKINSDDDEDDDDDDDDDDYGPRIVEIIEEKPAPSLAASPPKPQKKSSKILQLKRMKKKFFTNVIAYPRLKCDFRSPKTIWRQDDSLIVIRIAAPENVQYDLILDSDSLKLCYLHDDEKYLVSILFFASILPEQAVHEIRGLSIVVRVVKLVLSMHWPSLMRYGDKVPWLQQCIEVPNSDETDATDGMQRALPTVPNLETSTDSMSDEPDFGDQIDRFDPIEDDYFLAED